MLNLHQREVIDGVRPQGGLVQVDGHVDERSVDQSARFVLVPHRTSAYFSLGNVSAHAPPNTSSHGDLDSCLTRRRPEPGLRHPAVAPPSGVEAKLNEGAQLQTFTHPTISKSVDQSQDDIAVERRVTRQRIHVTVILSARRDDGRLKPRRYYLIDETDGQETDHGNDRQYSSMFHDSGQTKLTY